MTGRDRTTADRPDGGGDSTRDRPPRGPDTLLRRAGVRPDTRRDQHFLVDDRVLNRLPTYAIDAGFDLGHVVEVGAGTGALTDRLLRVADRVTAVERDHALAAFLRREFAADVADGRLAVVEGDALEVALPAFTASVSNLPYGASSPICFRLLPLRRPLLLMVQREFADRMAAAPGTPEYGRLSVTAGHYAAIEVVEVVPPTAFTPPPAVESAVVRTTPREPPYEVPDEGLFLDVVTALFTQRRKTVRNAIRNTTHRSGIADPEAVIAALPEDWLSNRPGDLDPAAFARIASLAAEREAGDGGVGS